MSCHNTSFAMNLLYKIYLLQAQHRCRLLVSNIKLPVNQLKRHQPNYPIVKLVVREWQWKFTDEVSCEGMAVEVYRLR
jgi:hypothetical protein